jgi:hypothetical protein
MTDNPIHGALQLALVRLHCRKLGDKFKGVEEYESKSVCSVFRLNSIFRQSGGQCVDVWGSLLRLYILKG